MPLPLLAQIAIAIVVQFISIALQPRPKIEKPDSVTQLEDPTIETGRAKPVIFGTVWVKEVQVNWFGDKGSTSYEVKA